VDGGTHARVIRAHGGRLGLSDRWLTPVIMPEPGVSASVGTGLVGGPLSVSVISVSTVRPRALFECGLSPTEFYGPARRHRYLRTGDVLTA